MLPFMKRIISLALLLTVFIPVFGQEDDPIEELMTRRYLSCTDILYNVSHLVPEYYKKGNKDTLQAILKFWEDRCDIFEALIRCKIVLSIDDGTFSENLYDDRIISALYQYRRSLSYVEYSNYQSYSLSGNLNKFTNNLSVGLLALRKDLSPVERFFLLWYSDDFNNALKMLDSDELNGTKLQEIYLKMKKEDEHTGHWHWDIMAGIWIPNGNLDVVGPHPFLGFRFGVRYPKLTVDLALGFKFITSPNTYQVSKAGTVWDTDHFFGGYAGIDAAYKLFSAGKNRFDMIGGIAWDGFDALSVDKDGSDDKITKSINSLNLNIGLGYKFNFKNNRYLGIDCKYNFVNYKNSGGTNLDGNAFTINLIFGGFSNLNKWRYY